MSRRPFFQNRLLRTPADVYEAAAPVSVLRALATRSNLQFLIDEFPQHRFNYVAGSTVFEVIPDALVYSREGESAYTFKWAHGFELTWIRADYSAGIDLLVAAKVGSAGGDDLTIEARIVPYFAPLYDRSYPSLGEASATTTGAGTTCEIDSQYIFSTPMNPSDQVLVHSVEEDGFVASPRTMHCRLELFIDVPADDTASIVEIYLREFACQS